MSFQNKEQQELISSEDEVEDNKENTLQKLQQPFQLTTNLIKNNAQQLDQQKISDKANRYGQIPEYY